MEPNQHDEMERALSASETREQQVTRHVEEAAFRAEVRARLADLEQALAEIAAALRR